MAVERCEVCHTRGTETPLVSVTHRYGTEGGLGWSKLLTAQIQMCEECKGEYRGADPRMLNGRQLKRTIERLEQRIQEMDAAVQDAAWEREELDY